MFNELCRVAVQQDLLDSLEILGVDLTWRPVYVDSEYAEAYKAWFWVEGQAAMGQRKDQIRPRWADSTIKATRVWRAVESAKGLTLGAAV